MSQFRNLVFEGGGVKGIAYAGALELLETGDDPVLPDIRRVAGTSAGAITATLMALGAAAKEIADIVGGTHFRDFMDDSFGVVRDVNRLVEHYGWFKGDAFSDWMRKQVHVLCGNSDITFAELEAKARQARSKMKELFVVGTSLTMQMPMVYSAETTPNFPIWEATRISMSIPLFFAAVAKSKQILVDGGVTWNYPLDLFDDKKFVDPADSWKPKPPNYPTTYDENHIYNKQTLGFRVDTQDEIRAEKESWKLPPAKIDDFVDYLKVLVGYMGDMANKMHLHDNDWHRTIAIDAAGVRSTQFDLSEDKVAMLVKNGRKAATDYFAWFKDPSSNPLPLNRVA
jgi:NTE family protein